MPRRMLVLAISLLALYLALTAVACVFQRSLIYPAPTPREVASLGGELLRIPASGRTVVALYFAAPPGARTIVYFHGNGEQLADDADLARAMHDAGFGVLAVEYPGYGLAASDRATEPNLYDAAEHALAYLRDTRGVDRDHVVLFGQSLGTGVAAEMALRGRGARLILASPYTSMPAMASRVAWFLPTSLLVFDRFDTARKAPHIAMPVLIVHGTDDEVVPVEMGRRLGGLFPHAEVDLVRGAHHNDLWAHALLERVAAFARR